MFLIEATEQNLSLFGEVLSRSWDENSCWPGCWNPKNPQAGHCRVSAALTQDYFGGDILFAHVLDGTHYWNRLPDGKEIDYTRSQFPEDTFIPSGVIHLRQQVMDSRRMDMTYPVLLERVQTKLQLRRHLKSELHTMSGASQI